MFQCPPGSPKDNRNKAIKDKRSSTSTASTEPQLKPKSSQSVGGWSWPRLVKVPGKQGEHMPSSTAATAASSAPQSRNDSTAAPVPEYAETQEMPEVRRDIPAEAGMEHRRSVSSRASSASSVKTMTQGHETQEPEMASVGGGPDIDKRRAASSDSSISSLASNPVPGGFGQAGTSKRPSVGGDQKGSESAKGPQSPLSRAIAPRRDLDSLTDDRTTESNASKVSSRQRVSIAEPLPMPRILIQQPSEASDARGGSPRVAAAPRIIERPLPVERRDSFEQARARINQEIASEIAKLSPRPMSDADAQVEPKALRPRKSAIAVRRTRNACVRRTFLKGLLGRELAGPTKTALRKRARGEQVTIEDVSNLDAKDVAVALIP